MHEHGTMLVCPECGSLHPMNDCPKCGFPHRKPCACGDPINKDSICTMETPKPCDTSAMKMRDVVARLLKEIDILDDEIFKAALTKLSFARARISAGNECFLLGQSSEVRRHLNMLAVVLNETIGHDITRKQW